MKKLLTLTIIFVFSAVLIGCSSSVENSPKSPDTNSTTARPVTSIPSTSDGKSDADAKSDTDKNSNQKSNTNKPNDGKSDADRTNTNQ